MNTRYFAEKLDEMRAYARGPGLSRELKEIQKLLEEQLALYKDLEREHIRAWVLEHGRTSS